MKIGILGSGAVAQSLGKGFVKHGYEVKLGTRDKGKLGEWLKETGSKASVGSLEEAATFGELIVLAVKGSVAKDVLRGVSKHIEGKIVIDTTNPIADVPPVNGILKFSTSLDSSLMEHLQKDHPRARFVKAFNSIGSAHMVNPEFEDGKPSMFICGNDDNAKKEVSKILNLFGFVVEDMGKVEAARAIEPLCILWCIPGFLRNEWNHAFKLLKK